MMKDRFDRNFCDVSELLSSGRRVFTGFCVPVAGAYVALSAGMHVVQPDPQTFQIIGAAMEVHRQLHRGLYEGFYCAALAVEFELRRIPFHAQRPIQLEYKGRCLAGLYHLDFICFESIVLEVKAVSALTPADESQLLELSGDDQAPKRLADQLRRKITGVQKRVL
jgi:GxxExxY protein